MKRTTLIEAKESDLLIKRLNMMIGEIKSDFKVDCEIQYSAYYDHDCGSTYFSALLIWDVPDE